ncbi:TonB-dependent receptor [Pollutibacter soli]|uniref:TonB-dependent receptor n=1 Tax=Pollutibacter soli TaxID=3034157 RepID=UPI003013F502
MRTIIIAITTLLSLNGIQAQHILRARVVDNSSNLLVGVSVVVESIKKNGTSDSTGIVTIDNIPTGTYEITFSHVGYEELKMRFTFPLSIDSVILVKMKAQEEEEEEIIITSARISRSIANIPTRVETISGEELEEKANMKPGDIRMLLSESTGIQTQQTSATSANSSIRIQGLDGKYTQIIRDGLPMYSGYSGGLSIMQVAPLDLQQVEVIKGSASTLYGGGAIAGLVNLVSRVPGNKRRLDFMANVTSAGGWDFSGFYSQKFKKTGVTLFSSGNSNRAYDAADLGLTSIPQFERYTVSPKLFLYFTDKTVMNVGFTGIFENRVGGDMNYIREGSPGYFEKNKTKRLTGEFSFRHVMDDHSSLQAKASINNFDRRMEIPDYFFQGLQQSFFSELNYVHVANRMQWVGGMNFITDKFSEVKQQGVDPRDYTQQTLGVFIQNTWTPVKWFILETGLRGNQVNKYGFNVLPRVSALFKITPELSSRAGGGLGYKTPTVFNEDAERIQYQQVLPINPDNTNTERSAGINLDINYRTKLFGEIGFTWNQLFFYTRLNNPLVLTGMGNGEKQFLNANGHIDTRGTETNLRFSYKDFKLFVGYTYTNVNTHYDGQKQWFTLSPHHRLNNVLVYEKEESLKLGLEAYYTSPQKLSDGGMGKPFWVCGFMAEKLWEKFSIFINFENIFDTRQTRFDTIFTGPLQDPVFRDIYAPVDGFIVNGGLKVRF